MKEFQRIKDIDVRYAQEYMMMMSLEECQMASMIRSSMEEYGGNMKGSGEGDVVPSLLYSGIRDLSCLLSSEEEQGHVSVLRFGLLF